MGKRIKLREGDIFTIALADQRVGLGQITHPGTVFHVIMFGEIFSGAPELLAVDGLDIVVAGWTTDGEFYRGNWVVIGNAPVLMGRVPQPCSKVESNGGRWVCDFFGQPVRLASEIEWEGLPYHRSANSPLFVEALEAELGIREWPYKIELDPYTARYRRHIASICQV